MPIERYFADCPFSTGEVITLSDQEAHHLIRVMRTKIGDKVELINGRNQLAQTEVIVVKKNEALLKILSFEQRDSKRHHLVLCQAFPRSSHLDFIIEKATELGVNEIILFPGFRSEKKELSAQQWKRLHILMVAALKQSGRWDLPVLHVKPRLNLWSGSLEGSLYFGSLDSKAAYLAECFEKMGKASYFFIGPESGFDPQEIKILIRWGSQGIRLNENTLRTETAAMIAIGLMSHLLS
jgi:16S rRNA (uracil1498-N3)-methyltransferase